MTVRLHNGAPPTSDQRMRHRPTPFNVVATEAEARIRTLKPAAPTPATAARARVPFRFPST